MFVSLGIVSLVLCTVPQFYKLNEAGDRTYCATTSVPNLPPGHQILFIFLIEFYQYLFSVVLDVDSLYKKTKVILERRVRAGELSSDEEQRILAVLSYSQDDTATVLESTKKGGEGEERIRLFNRRCAEVTIRGPLGLQQS